MTRPVRILRRAEDDLFEIHDYVGREAPEAATRLFQKLPDRIEGLGRFSVGLSPRDERLRARGYRVLVEGEYLIFYKDFRRHIRVYRVLHGKRKYWRLL